jgi:predicted membrane protein
MSALSMDDKGLSLKKILAAFSTFEAARFTDAWLAPNNVIILVLMWLIYAGILVGVYSINDISNAINKYKGNDTTKN